MIIRPILTYGATVWWMRVNYNLSRRELNKLQRLACLAITGVMKTTPTAAMEVLLGLPPLHVIIASEAQAGIYRLCAINSADLDLLTMVTLKRLQTWSKNPSF
jgi:hypothetical protein